MNNFGSMSLLRPFLFVGLICVVLSGCRILTPSIMLKTPKDFTFDIPPDSVDPQYVLAPNDKLQFQIFTNDGFRLIDMSGVNSSGGMNNNMRMQGGLPYEIEYDGLVKLPILGRINLVGKTIREAENYLQTEYSKFYNNPFVMLTILNKRVFVFPGSGSSAQVIILNNNSTTLMEVMAQIGGISGQGKAYKIKIIRGIDENKKIYNVDLSTIEGLQYSDMVLQSHDIVYVEPRIAYISEVLQEITPIIALISNSLIIYGYFTVISGN